MSSRYKSTVTPYWSYFISFSSIRSSTFMHYHFSNFFFYYFLCSLIAILAIYEYAVSEYDFVLEFNVASYGNINPYFFHNVVRHIIISSTLHKFNWSRFSFGSNFNSGCVFVSGDIGVITEFDNIIATF